MIRPSEWLFRAVRPARFAFLRELEATQWASPGEIRAIQSDKLRRLLLHAGEHVPFYRERFRAAGFDPREADPVSRFPALPLLEKAEIVEERERLKAENRLPKDFLRNFTGGSTGERLVFFEDRAAVDMNKAIEWRGYRWAGWTPGGRRVYLWGSNFDLSLAKRFRTRVKNRFLHHRMILSSYKMSEARMEEYRKALLRYRPQLLIGFAGALALLAEFLRNHRRPAPSPSAVISSAETLDEGRREIIESAFDCPVFNRYGCREVGGIAHECHNRQGLHIQAEHVFLEVLDASGQPVPPGKPGEIVITDLDNFAFPLIRYRIGDMGTLSGSVCSCGMGLPLLQEVRGRVWDVLVGLDDRFVVGSFWLIKGIEGIRKYQIVQEKKSEIEIRLVVDEFFPPDGESRMRRRAAEFLGPETAVTFRRLEDLPPSPSGKHRYVISKVSPFIGSGSTG